ncbi:MAG: hypothetical protein FWC26_07565 [Fibromonadales bacterium]|nr:hypothetical protein [Fibromonadales bacterium]
MPCPFCTQSEPVRIEIKALNLRICPNCLATFIPASQFATLRSVLSDTTKAAWMRKLNTVGADPNITNANCLDHGTPLAAGTVPGYSFQGVVPACCDLQHLPPSLMATILQLSLGGSPGISMGHFGISKTKPNPIAGFLGNILFGLFEKRKKVDDGLERLQYESKFKGVLGEWVD